MIIGNYKIGKYPAIIKKTHEDGLILYETDFDSSKDLAISANALSECIGKMCGIGTNHPAVLSSIEIILGKEAITKELDCK